MQFKEEDEGRRLRYQKKQSISDLCSKKPTPHAWEHTSPNYLFWLCRYRQLPLLPAPLFPFHSERTRIVTEPTLKSQCYGYWPQGQSVCQTAAGKTALYSWLQSPDFISPSFFLTVWHQLRNQNNNDDNLGVRLYGAEQSRLDLALPFMALQSQRAVLAIQGEAEANAGSDIWGQQCLQSCGSLAMTCHSPKGENASTVC